MITFSPYGVISCLILVWSCLGVGKYPPNPIRSPKPPDPIVRPSASHIRTDMENHFIIFWIFGQIRDFSNLVEYPPDPSDQLTINIYKIKKNKKILHLSYLIFFTELSFFLLTLSQISSLSSHLSALISQSSKS